MNLFIYGLRMILIYACDGLFKPSALLCIQPFSCLCFIPSNNYYTFVRNSDKFSSTADIYPSPPPSISFHPTSIHKESQSLVLHKMIAERTFSSLLHTAVSPAHFVGGSHYLFVPLIFKNAFVSFTYWILLEEMYY